MLARGSALRFMLTRLYDWLTIPDGALVQKRDPLEYHPPPALSPRDQIALRVRLAK